MGHQSKPKAERGQPEGLRLAFVYPALIERGGAENALVDALAALAARGHHISLFTAAVDAERYVLPPGVHLHLLGGRGFMTGLGGTLRYIAALSRMLRGHDLAIPVNFPAHVWTLLGWHGVPSVWWCMEPKRNLYPQVMYAEAPGFMPHQYRTRADYRGLSSLLTLLLRDPHVLLPYGIRAALQRLLDRAAVRRTAAILAISPYVAGKIETVYRRPSTVIWTGVPLPPDGAMAGALAAEWLIVVPTRLEPIKNAGVVLESVARCGAALDGWTVAIVGTGSELEALQARCVGLGVVSRVAFTGFVSAADRDRLLQRCAFIVYPSLAEPFGLPVAEAAALGRTAIADRHGGPADQIVDGETGLHVDMRDPDALAAAMTALASDTARARRMGAAARLRWARLFALDRWADGFEAALYAQLRPETPQAVR
ncbi:MAG: glycosyltransferase family 4 protein [Chloroflexi bacterium]|nr:glycosyltransferase family 4 protein [Chloroflexota bacterium]